ncbi:Transcriptional repressor MprA [Poriferisphaera corsica]|uniref:Transcriptional repressor MprA n=1 Tax=Poriferisphaera corsica TaxID=2528020 RepID=A0A517YY31_9BACT|nr:MarR family transcriptional regulator [Poriferisphaera corsica]QDU35116.1 Transcriptional repressor MprA [Poriferisphaera corsica]
MFLLQDLPDEQVITHAQAIHGQFNRQGLLLFLQILKTGSDLLNNLDQFLSKYNLKHGRWITLVLLQREPSQTSSPSELAKKQGITRATMTNLLNSLENDLYIERIEHPTDARATNVKLTRKGRNLLKNIMPRYYQAINQLTAECSTKQLKDTQKMLNLISGKSEEIFSQ